MSARLDRVSGNECWAVVPETSASECGASEQVADAPVHQASCVLPCTEGQHSMQAGAAGPASPGHCACDYHLQCLASARADQKQCMQAVLQCQVPGSPMITRRLGDSALSPPGESTM